MNDTDDNKDDDNNVDVNSMMMITSRLQHQYLNIFHKEEASFWTANGNNMTIQQQQQPQ